MRTTFNLGTIQLIDAMRLFLLTSLLLASNITSKAECRKDTIYTSTIEYGIVYPKSRIINQYNNQNTVIESIEQNWNTGSKTYSNENKETNTYNSNGKLSEKLIQVWNVNIWVNYAKEIHTIDANGNVTEYLSQNWLNTWQDRTKIQNTFNSSNKKTSSIVSSWNYFGNNSWDKRSKDSIIYDMNQNILENYQYLFNETFNKWEAQTLYKYKYNSNSLVSAILELDWYMNKWDSTSNVLYTYNSNQQKNQEIIERWDYTYGKYISNRTSNIYNSNNTLSQKLTEEWNPIDKVWVNYYKETYSYDGNGNLISISKYFDWDKSQNQFNLETKEVYKCSQLVSINSINKNEFNIYPNPANNSIYIETKSIIQKVEIYNNNGVLLIKKEGITNFKEMIDLQTFNNGLYFIKCYFENSILTQKFIIQH